MNKLYNLLSSYRLSIILLLIYATMMAIGTWVEEAMNTTAAKMLVYYSPLFITVHLLFIVNFLLILSQKNFVKTKQWALLVIHLSLIVIMIGAMTTHVIGKEGSIHLRVGEATSEMTSHTSRGTFTHALPFTVELSEFRLVRYPGSNSASSYESDLVVTVDNQQLHETIYMNRVLDVKGYRLFQSSYDEDEQGSILAVNHDVAGRTITYIGYTALILGFLLMFLLPNSRLRRLGRQLQRVRKRTIVGLIALLSLTPTQAQQFTQHAAFLSAERNAIPLEHAQQFGTLPVQLQGRIVPMNTFSAQVLRKLYKSEQIGSLTPDQFLLGWMTQPNIWMEVPMLSVKDDGLAQLCGVTSDAVSYAQLFDTNGSYRLVQPVAHASHQAPAERSATDKALLKLDEQVNIIYMLIHGLLPNILPDRNDEQNKWHAPGGDISMFAGADSLAAATLFQEYLVEVIYAQESNDWHQAEEALLAVKEFQRNADSSGLISPDKIEAELRYNRLQIFSTVGKYYFILGGLLLLIAIVSMLRPNKALHYISYIIITGIALLSLYHVYGMILRWQISGYAPWSNSYETMIYVAWSAIITGFIFGRRNFFILALATLLGGVILFVSRLNWMDPQITTLVPVLKSRWLMFHVAITISAYGFFGISFLLGIVSMLMMLGSRSKIIQQQIKELTIVNNMSLLIGLALMTTGTFLGAVWANESWGRYWSWDPKETWALITVVIYGAVTHLHLLKHKRYNWLFNFSSVLAFASVLMTYLGVNYFLSGLHSYGEADGVGEMLVAVAVVFGLIVLLGIASGYKESRTIDKR